MKKLKSLTFEHMLNLRNWLFPSGKILALIILDPRVNNPLDVITGGPIQYFKAFDV